MPIEEVVNYQLHNMFPTTAYVGEMNGHARHKEVFYREIYPSYQFPRINVDGDINTVSESEGKPIIHTEESAVPMMKEITDCLLYTSPSPRDATLSRMPSSA